MAHVAGTTRHCLQYMETLDLLKFQKRFHAVPPWESDLHKIPPATPEAIR